MEVETQTLSNSDIQSNSKPPFSYSLTNSMAIASSQLHSHEFQRLEMHDYPLTDTPKSKCSESPPSENSGEESPTKFDSSEMPFAPIKSPVLDGQDALGAPGRALTEESAAVKLQKVYLSYRTRRQLADSAVVAEELWWQAIDFARLNHSTISFFNFSKQETAVTRWSRISLNASKVGKGLSMGSKAQKLAFQHWIEAIDPRHRYGHSLHLYYDEWCKADGGQPFFFWMDVGDGKELDLKECPRSKLRQQSIKYLGPQEREHYEYIVVEGKIVRKQTGDLLDTDKGTKWIFVMSTSKKLYAGEKKKGKFHHSSFLAGGATLAAGRLEAENGNLKFVSPYSGHYRPTDDTFGSFLSYLKENGIDLDEVQIHKAKEDSDIYEDSKLNGGSTTLETSTSLLLLTESDIPTEAERHTSSEPTNVSKTESKSDYRRSLSGGLQSPRAALPKNVVLQRINSKKAARSYQLGHQLSLKWSTGAGPRIGCVADYPVELRVQALEYVELSPRSPPTPSAYRRFAGLASPTKRPALDLCNGDGNSGD